ncbi:MAG TPA: hypothetical protein VHC22_07390 [Pirellulales bacterium]|nr:hypothetical protein [Pirellulales bacterium]
MTLRETVSLRSIDSARRTLFTTSSLSASEVADRCGDDCYSYFFVQRAFLPLLERWAAVEEVSDSSENLQRAFAGATRAGKSAVHLSFLPLQYFQFLDGATNVAFPFWEYPDIPNYDVAGNPRNNWVRMADCLDLIFTACNFTRDSFLRAGVQTPLEVVSVPIADRYFDVPAWEADQRVTLDCPCYRLPQGDPPGLYQFAERAARRASMQAREQVRGIYRRNVRPLLPGSVHKRLANTSHVMIGKEPEPVAPTPVVQFPIPYAPSDGVELSGVVYTTILNPFDIRKNWRGIVDSFLRAVGDAEDATLVIKLAVSQRMRQEALHNLLHFYRRLRLRHRAQVYVISDYLSDEQMCELTRGTTFYLNASHAEGACLPLQDSLAAGRPGVAPAHTAMAEYIDSDVAFVVPSRAEPIHWQWDPERRRTTTWQHMRRRDLVSQIRASYQTARNDLAKYQAMALRGRQRMYDLAGTENVWARLSAALNALEASPALAPQCVQLQANPLPRRQAA